MGKAIGIACCIAAAVYHAGSIYRDYKKESEAREKVIKRNNTIQKFFEEKGC